MIDVRWMLLALQIALVFIQIKYKQPWLVIPVLYIMFKIIVL
nr:MAG TPA: hypothetical protein [Caudoviricetes sp.]